LLAADTIPIEKASTNTHGATASIFFDIEHFFGKARGDKMEEKKMGVEDF
jgi:hypothetical protein